MQVLDRAVKRGAAKEVGWTKDVVQVLHAGNGGLDSIAVHRVRAIYRQLQRQVLADGPSLHRCLSAVAVPHADREGLSVATTAATPAAPATTAAAVRTRTVGVPKRHGWLVLCWRIAVEEVIGKGVGGALCILRVYVCVCTCMKGVGCEQVESSSSFIHAYIWKVCTVDVRNITSSPYFLLICRSFLWFGKVSILFLRSIIISTQCHLKNKSVLRSSLLWI